jgi:hypothetical protein
LNKKYRPPERVRIRGREKWANRYSIRAASFSHTERSNTLAAIVLNYTTSFIWLTPPEVCGIVEQIDDKIEEHKVRAILYYLHRTGRMDKRASGGTGRSNGCQFKKVVAHAESA